jgi:hypothetical protein
MAGYELGKGVPQGGIGNRLPPPRPDLLALRLVDPEISPGVNDRQTAGDAYMDSVFHKLKPP